MINRRSHILCVWFLACDLTLTGIAWLAAFFLRFETGWFPITKTPPDFHLCLRNLPLVVLVGAIAYRIAGQETLLFDRASKFNSDFPATVSDNPGSVELEVRDQFSLDELARRFSGRAMPCKFAVVVGGGKTLVWEFRERLA